MSPTTDDQERTDEHYRRELRRRAFSTLLTIIGILIVIASCVLFLMSVKPG